MDLTTITVQQFKTQFYRDFIYANQNPNPEQVPPESPDIVQDIDIQNAYNYAIPMLNQRLFQCNNAAITQGFLLLAAHYLCLNIRNSMSGLNGTGSGGFPVSARTVGSVSESYSIPEAYTEDPLLAQYTQTSYGLQYLGLVLPFLRGNIVAVWGGALP